MPRSIAQISKWRNRLTPQEKSKWQKSISEGRAKAKAARVEAIKSNGTIGRTVSINFAERGRENNEYVKGSSRTVVLNNCPFDPDGIIERLMPHIRELTCTILRDNHTNKLRLIELKEWARQSKMPDSVLGQIDQALWSHSDPQEPYDDAPVDL